MKINRLFSIAAAALMMVACSSEDTALKNTPAAGPQMQFTATIAAPSSGTTRTAYTESGTDINVAWKVGDEIALIHGNVRDVATVKTINADGSATINGYVTGATNNEIVTLYYPAARMISNGQGGFTFDPVIEGKKLTQDGTLKYIQDNLDFREGEGKLSVNGTEVTLKEPVKMAAENAIWKLALKDDAETPAALAASQLAIMIGSDTIASTAILSTAASTVYLAVPGMADQAISIGATVEEDTYSCTNEGVTLGAKYYQSTVTMTKMTAIDLSKLTADYKAQDGDVLTGILGANVQISIAAGATVTLDGVTITGENHPRYTWAGITCEGDATIILKDGSTNTVKGFYAYYPGIDVPGDAENPANNKTLTIKGTGSLTASSNGNGAGIGGGYGIACGNIKIEGGTITATGSSDAAGIGSANNSSCGSITISGGTIKATGGNEGAGIGSGYKAKCGDITISGGTIEPTGGTDAAGIGSGYDESASCGDITISGGTVTATGGIGGTGIGSGYLSNCGDITISGGTVTATGRNEGAGIGSSDDGKCGNITITTGVTKVTATKGSGSPNSIGIGPGRSGSCGTVTIGGTVYWNGSAYQNGGDTYLVKSKILYPVPDPIELSAVTSSQLGWIVGNDGKAYAVEALPESVKAVAKICYVGSSTGVEGYTLGLALALTDESSTMSWTDATGASGAAAHTPAAPTTITSSWMLPSYDQWDKMITAAGGYEALRDGFSGIAGASNLQSGGYWSSTENGSNRAYYYDFNSASRVSGTKSSNWIRVRACLAF